MSNPISCPHCGAPADGEETISVESPKRSAMKIPCPDCYGGHFRPCQTCGDSGVALFIPNEEKGQP